MADVAIAVRPVILGLVVDVSEEVLERAKRMKPQEFVFLPTERGDLRCWPSIHEDPKIALLGRDLLVLLEHHSRRILGPAARPHSHGSRKGLYGGIMAGIEDEGRAALLRIGQRLLGKGGRSSGYLYQQR